MPVIDQWYTIATAGPTADGRVIEEQWLRDAAETYDPDYYTAVIDSEHELEWYGCFGHVTELRLGTKFGRVSLEAKVNANRRLLAMNAEDQRLFPSIWPAENFSDTGMTYLYRLAMTNSPASIGTDMMKFSTQGNGGQTPVFSVDHVQKKLGKPESQPGTGAAPAEPTFTAKEKSLLTAIKELFSGKPDPAPEPNTPDDQPQDDDIMNEEQFAAFMQQQKDAAAAQLEAINSLGEKFSAAPNANDGTPGDEGAADEPETVSAEKFNALQSEFDEFKTKFAAAMAEQPGTPQGEHNGADGADEGKQFQSVVC